MPVPNTIADLNQAAASNFPLGTDTVGPSLDDYLRAGFSFTRQLFDGTPWLLGSIAGTADAITATCPVPFTAYVAGQSFKFMPTANNTTNAVTININGIGAKSVTRNGALPLAAGDLLTGVAAIVLYDGTNFQLVSTPGTQNITSGYSVSGLTGTNNSTTPNTKFDFSADAVTLKGVGRPSFTGFGTGAITNDIAAVQSASTANGRDQIAMFSASSWIHFYYIWNGTTLATLSSVVTPATGPTLPTGYTHWAYLGAVYYTSAPALSQVRIKGATVSYVAEATALSSGTATSETPVSLTAFIPPNAVSFSVNLRQNPTSNGTGFASIITVLRVVSGVNIFTYPYQAYNGTATSTVGLGFGCQVSNLPNLGQNISYLQVNTTGTGALSIIPISYRVPNGGE